MKIRRRVKLGGHTFHFRDDRWSCRGDSYYDEEGDESIEPSLVEAGERLQEMLEDEGYKIEMVYGEKGWLDLVLL